jgi:hypothetical protein
MCGDLARMVFPPGVGSRSCEDGISTWGRLAALYCPQALLLAPQPSALRGDALRARLRPFYRWPGSPLASTSGQAFPPAHQDRGTIAGTAKKLGVHRRMVREAIHSALGDETGKAHHRQGNHPTRNGNGKAASELRASQGCQVDEKRC